MIAALALAACEHPDNSEEVPYYITENICYIDATAQTQGFSHTPLGLTGGETDVVYTIPIRLKKATTKDVDVYLDLSSDSDLLTADYVRVSALAVTIPAGETEAEVTLSVTNYSVLANTDDAVTANIALTLADVQNAYPAQERNAFKLTVTKSAYTKIVNGSIEEGAELDRSGWTVTNLNNGSITTSLTDNNYYSYLYTEPIYISIDFGDTHKITGFENTCYPYTASYYTFQTMEFSYSLDGETWEDLGTMTDLPAAYYQYFYFPGGYSCRYLRVKMYDGMDDGWGVSTEIFVWAND